MEIDFELNEEDKEIFEKMDKMNYSFQGKSEQ